MDPSIHSPLTTPIDQVPVLAPNADKGSPATDNESSATDNNESSASRGTIRVLHVINGEHYSGAERVQDLLALRLPELGVETGFACIKPVQFEALRSSDSPLWNVPMGFRFDLRPVGRLVQLVKRERFEILHAHTPRSALIAAMASMRTGMPLVYHVHSPTSRDSTRKLHNLANQWVERFAARRALRLITVSQSLAGHMQRWGFPEKQIRVVPNGVPAVDPLPQRAPPGATWTLGTVALFRPRKGTEVLLDAIAALRSEGLDVRLRAVGGFETEEYENQLKSQAARLQIESSIEWTGFTRDVNAELAQMDLFVLPSLFGEGLPMVVLEAMATGLPVVGTRVEGVPEAVREGREGALAEPGDAESLAVALRRFVEGSSSLWTRFSRQAMQRHAERFSDHAMAAGTAEVYRELLAE